MENGEKKELEADYIIMSLGNRPNRTLYEEVKEEFEKVYAIGDAYQCGTRCECGSYGFERAYTLE